jgi:predicted DNA-binding protein (UPF0251 family)
MPGANHNMQGSDKIWKKVLKKVKKAVDKRVLRCYISRAPVRAPASPSSSREKSFEKTKIFLDIAFRLCYYNQADADEAGARMYLEN